MDQQNNYQPSYQAPVTQQPNLLIFGILSLVLSTIPALILGIMGKKKGDEYIAQGGTLTGASKVGYILSKVGMILGIVGTAILAIYIVILIIGLIAAGANS